jgi:hypothetical protein
MSRRRGRFGLSAPRLIHFQNIKRLWHASEENAVHGKFLPDIPKSNGRYPSHETDRNKQVVLLDAVSSKPAPKAKPVRYSIFKRKKVV